MPPTRAPSQPWYTSITIDLLLKFIKTTFFQPFVCALVPLCLRAAETPWTEQAMINSIIWAILVTFVRMILGPINEKLAYGAPREMDHEEEVIVITGGASGLGRCLAEIWAMKGASVAVLDIKGEDDEAAVEGVEYYECDISDRKAVEKCWAAITKELGTPTILVNNAGVVHGKRMLDMSFEDISSSFAVNTLPHYHLTKLFLPPLLEREAGGTIVTVSSVLAHLGASQLSAYTATKSALLAMHQSLVAELRPHPNIKNILVAPGQLSSEMFSSLASRNLVENFFGPTVEVSELSVQITNMVNEGSGGTIAEPAYARWIGILSILPVGVQRLFRDLAGIDRAMEQFGKSGDMNGATKEKLR